MKRKQRGCLPGGGEHCSGTAFQSSNLSRYIIVGRILKSGVSIGFWLVGGLLTLIYAAVFGLLAYFISEHDPIWDWVIFALVFLVVGALHLRARDN